MASSLVVNFVGLCPLFYNESRNNTSAFVGALSADDHVFYILIKKNGKIVDYYPKDDEVVAPVTFKLDLSSKPEIFCERGAADFSRSVDNIIDIQRFIPASDSSGYGINLAKLDFVFSFNHGTIFTSSLYPREVAVKSGKNPEIVRKVADEIGLYVSDVSGGKILKDQGEFFEFDQDGVYEITYSNDCIRSSSGDCDYKSPDFHLIYEKGGLYEIPEMHQVKIRYPQGYYFDPTENNKLDESVAFSFAGIPRICGGIWFSE